MLRDPNLVPLSRQHQHALALCVRINRAALAKHLEGADAAVIMKVGHNLEKIKEALTDAGRFGDAIYVERGTMPGERIVPLAELGDCAVPYFSIILLPGGRGRRIT